MQKQKPIDETASRLGAIMCNARRMMYMPHDEVAKMLLISPAEMLEYERGTTKIPADVLERVIVMGYKMIRVRTLEDRYRRQRRVFNKIKQSVAETP